jgi:hypothetical protein
MAAEAPEHETALNAALTELETSLLTPIVSGELDGWVQSVRQSLAKLGPLLENYIRSVLHVQYGEIVKADSELLPRVEQLIEEDQKLLEEWQAFEQELATLTQRAPDALKDELKVAGNVNRVEERGTRLILRVRKQQAAATTWLAESLYRDRGPVD